MVDSLVAGRLPKLGWILPFECARRGRSKRDELLSAKGRSSSTGLYEVDRIRSRPPRPYATHELMRRDLGGNRDLVGRTFLPDG